MFVYLFTLLGVKLLKKHFFYPDRPNTSTTKQKYSRLSVNCVPLGFYIYAKKIRRNNNASPVHIFSPCQTIFTLHQNIITTWSSFRYVYKCQIPCSIFFYITVQTRRNSKKKVFVLCVKVKETSFPLSNLTPHLSSPQKLTWLSANSPGL